MFVYALDSQESIANINTWVESVSPQRMEYAGADVNISKILVGNKTDLEERNVSKARVNEIMKNCYIKPELNFEVSALTGEGFDEMFVSIAREILNQGKLQSASGIHLGLSNQQTKPKKKCCD